MDPAGNLMVPCIYDWVDDFQQNTWTIVKQENRYNLIDTSGNTLLNWSEKEIRPIGHDYFLVFENNLGFINRFQQGIVSDIPVLHAEYLPGAGFRVQNQDGYGFFDSLGNQQIPFGYQKITPFPSLGFVVEGETHKGIFDWNGNQLTDTCYVNIVGNPDTWWVKTSGGFGLMSNTGVWISDTLFREIQIIDSGFSTLTCFDERTQTFSTRPEKPLLFLSEVPVTFPQELENQQPVYAYPLAFFQQRWWVLDAQNQPLFQVHSPRIQKTGHILWVDSSGYQAAYHTSGKKILNHEIKTIFPGTENLAIILSDSAFGLIRTTTGELVFPPQFKNMDVWKDKIKTYAFSGELTVYDIQENGSLQIAQQYKNAIQLTVKKVARNSAQNPVTLPAFTTFQTQIDNWFYDAGARLWGRVNDAGDTIIKPRFRSLEKVPGSPYVLVGQLVSQYKVPLRSGTLLTNLDYALYNDKILDYTIPFGIAGYQIDSSGDFSVTLINAKGQYMYVDKTRQYLNRTWSLILPEKDGLTPAAKTCMIEFSVQAASLFHRPIEDLRKYEANFIPKTFGVFLNGFEPYFFGEKKFYTAKGAWTCLEWRDTAHTCNQTQDPLSGLVVMESDRTFLVRNVEGKWILKSYLDEISLVRWDSVPYILKTTTRRKETFVDENGVIAGINYFENHQAASESRAVFRVGNKYGFYNTETGHIYDTSYAFIGDFSEGLAVAKTDRKFGYIDAKNQWQIFPEYRKAQPFSEGLAAVKTPEGWGYIDSSGSFIIPAQYTKANAFSGGEAWVESDKKWIKIDAAGNPIIEKKESIRKIKGILNLFLADENGNRKIIDSNGIEMPLKHIRTVRKYGDFGYSIYQKSGVSFIDTNYQIYTYKNLDRLNSWWNGYALGKTKSGEWVVVDATGKTVLALERTSKSLRDGYLITNAPKSHYAVVNLSGDTLFTTRNRLLSGPYNGRWIAQNGTLKMLVNDKGEIISSLETEIIPLKNGLFAALHDAYWGILDGNGKWRTDPCFSEKPREKENGFIGARNLFTEIYTATGVPLLTEPADQIIPVSENLLQIRCAASIGYYQAGSGWIWPIVW